MDVVMLEIAHVEPHALARYCRTARQLEQNRARIGLAQDRFNTRHTCLNQKMRTKKAVSAHVRALTAG
jgi:hypothetical protein